MSAQNLLVELCVEELPPKALKTLGDVFAATLRASLQKAGLAADSAVVSAYASPRRLAAHLTDVLAVAADQPVAQKLMPAAVGLDAAGKATPALLKKLAALGADGNDAAILDGLRRESDGKNGDGKSSDGKADILYYDSLAKGATLAEGLQKAIEAALAALPIPKVMTYQLADGWTTVNFVRPAHGLVALHGSAVVPVAVLGLTAGNATHGHRFEAVVDPVIIAHADDYVATLKRDGAVIASFAERRADIVRQLDAAAAQAGVNLKPIADEALLDEVTALVERPNVLIGQFEAEFLAVPQECLILTMKANQKYFPLLDAAGKLTNQFLVVSNISPTDASAVIGGNERVVRPRLADAKFFFDQDRKKTLESRVAGLSRVVYHNKLGTQGERVQRVAATARAIAGLLGANAVHAEQAARLAKADLLTDMVGEFPELQGTMGRYYALHDGLPADVADAIEDHYKPRFAGDSLPRGSVGTVVALADKLDTLVGMFGIGQVPTGDRDPFALRRHALGVLRLLIEQQLPLELPQLIEQSASAFAPGTLQDGFAVGLLAFINDRLRHWLKDQGEPQNVVEAVLGIQPTRIDRIPARLAAVRQFLTLPEAEALAAANKRIGNILKKADGVATLGEVNPALLHEAAEKALYAEVTRLAPQVHEAMQREAYTEALSALAQARASVDAFFNDVMVMSDDASVRNNRLALLQTLSTQMNAVADIARLAG